MTSQRGTPIPGGPLTWQELAFRRFTSRKFLLTVGAAVTIITAWAKGALPPAWAGAIVMVLTVVYTLVEGYIDAGSTSGPA